MVVAANRHRGREPGLPRGGRGCSSRPSREGARLSAVGRRPSSRRSARTAIRVGADVPERARADASGLAPTAPLALRAAALGTEEVSTALRICHAHGQPVVTQGGMTGLAGGAHPFDAEVALSLERMSGVEEVDAGAATLTALAGTAAPRWSRTPPPRAGFLCGIDLGARGTCTIGGNIATNAGGNNVVRYGMARRIRARPRGGARRRDRNALAQQDAQEQRRLRLDAAVHRARRARSGVVTRVVIGLHPRPEGVHTALCAVENADAALALLRALERCFAGGLLVFEGMWREFIRQAVDEVGLAAPFAEEHDVLVLVEAATGAGPEGAERFEEALGSLLEEGLVHDAVVARSEADRAKLWAFRESPYEYQAKLPKWVGFDVSFPRARIGEAVEALRAAAASRWPAGAERDLRPHRRFEPAPDRRGRGTRQGHGGGDGLCDRRGFRRLGLGRARDRAQTKRAWLALSRTAPELALMRTIKRALDPADLLNRGRVL